MPTNLLRDARYQVENFGRIGPATAAALEALSYDVPALEERLLNQMWRARA